ncbi:uncharacterized protein [Euphorbia lathyris]|uniref:uncharacterized protein n=1 Tax=Euphorbia lathyris TaxID=212925 RepID=UPI0033131204
METQHETPFYAFQKVGILLLFLVGFGFCIHDSSSSSEVHRCESNSYSNKYIMKSNSEEPEKFQDFTADKPPSCSCKWLPDDLQALLRLSVPNRLLIGEGSHRHLYSDIRIHSQAELIAQLPNHFCKVIIIERLPLGVFADPFELQHLLQRGAFTDIAVFGDTNLELPSVASNQTIVEIHMNVSSNIYSGNTNELQVSVDLPLHARYPPPSETGYAKIEFGRPDLFMQCSREGNSNDQSCLFTPITDHVVSKIVTMEWKIPSGTRSFAGVVSIITFAAAFISTLAIVVTSLFYSECSLLYLYKNQCCR